VTLVADRSLARRLVEPRASLAQRLSDALGFRVGTVPGARDYGSHLHDVLDRNVDRDFPARAFRAVAEAISRPANGLADLTLRRVGIAPDPGNANRWVLTVEGHHEGDAVAIPVVL